MGEKGSGERERSAPSNFAVVFTKRGFLQTGLLNFLEVSSSGATQLEEIFGVSFSVK